MKNKLVVGVLSLAMLFIAFSCSSDTTGEDEKGKKGQKETIDLTKDYRVLFPKNAVKEGVSFIGQLYLLNTRVDRVTLYAQKEFNDLYKQPIGRDLTIEKWTASSYDLFKKHTRLQEKVLAKFNKSIDGIIKLRQDYNRNPVEATKGNSGHVGTSNVTGGLRYVDDKGIELSEVIEKQIMGIILLDQIINNHLGETIMDNKLLKDQNTQRKFMAGKEYTELEYHWDLAYSLLGLESAETQPLFIANYLINQFQGADFLKGVDKRVFDAFKKGREALGKADYVTVKKQIEIIRENISKLYATRCVHYLKQSRRSLQSPHMSEYHKAFHPLSESYGFILSFVATRKADGTYFIEDYNVIEQMISDLQGEEGFWELDRLLGDENTAGSLDNISKRIGEIFEFDHTTVI